MNRTSFALAVNALFQPPKTLIYSGCVKALARILLICFLFSCSKQIEQESIPLQRIESIPSRQSVRDLFHTNTDSLNAVFVIGKNIVTFRHPSVNGEPHVRFFDLETMGEIKGLVPMGRGLDEMLLALPSVSEGQLLLRDIAQRQLAIIDVNDAILPTFRLKKYQTNILSQKIIPFEKKLMFVNPYSFRNKEKRILISDRSWNYKYRKKHSFNAFNVTGGELLYNSLKKTVFYLSKYEPVIEMMDSRGIIRKTITLPHSQPEITEIWHEQRRITEYVFLDQDKFPFDCFNASDSNHDFIAAVFQTDDWKSIVLILNWDGCIVDSFRAEASVKNISLSPDNRVVWCWEEDSGKNVLKEYSIEPGQ